MLVKETQILASCAYENQTKWGKEASTTSKQTNPLLIFYFPKATNLEKCKENYVYAVVSNLV
ncbi:hypothetical protein ACSBR2_020054 [Camellia fascicularis]